MSTAAVVILTLSPDELRALVRESMREVIAEQPPSYATSPLVDRHELARQLGVSPATISRMTREGMPHVWLFIK